MPGTLGRALQCTRFQLMAAEQSHGSLGGPGWPGRLHRVSCLCEAGGTSVIFLLVDNSHSVGKSLPDGHLQTKYLVSEPLRWHERIRITCSRVGAPSQSTAKLPDLFQEIMDISKHLLSIKETVTSQLALLWTGDQFPCNSHETNHEVFAHILLHYMGHFFKPSIRPRLPF